MYVAHTTYIAHHAYMIPHENININDENDSNEDDVHAEIVHTKVYCKHTRHEHKRALQLPPLGSFSLYRISSIVKTCSFLKSSSGSFSN